MNEFETSVVVFLALVAVAVFVYYKIKQAEARIEAAFEEAAKVKRRAELSQRIDKRAAEDQERRALRNAFPVEKNVIPTSSQIQSFTRPNSGFVQPSRTTSQSVAQTYTSSPRTTVVDNSSNDLLTAMILQNALNSSHYESPTTHYSNTSNPVDFPASTPESSYSSSYNSSSSDSSYSSSSSDSSYSSSSDSSSSSSSD